MEIKHCAICLASVEPEEAPILTISGSGIPRYLCPDCAADIDAATLGREPEQIREAMDRLAANLSAKNIDDNWTMSTVTDILAGSAARVKKIEDGEYDFSLDEESTESEEGELDEIPEDMLETEEDKALDEEEAAREKKIDRVFNWIFGGMIAVALALMIWWFLT